MEQQLLEKLDPMLELLSLDKSKQVRRKALESILKEVKIAVETKEETTTTNGNEIGDTVSIPFDRDRSLITSLITTISTDPVEKSRELSYQILDLLISNKNISFNFLPSLVPVLLSRLGGPELDEPSEELRLLAVQLMTSTLDFMGSKLAPFVDDWITILSVCVGDPYHEVRKTACVLIGSSGKILKDVFHYNSERLTKPLVAALVHQQSKVRLEAVKCIGEVLLFGSPKAFDDFISPLTLRSLDSNPNVRKSVVEVVGRWMMEFPDRYSHFQKMLPVILGGLCDDYESVGESALNLWEKIGDQYLEENIEDYKDQVDFPSKLPQDYPEDEAKRPNFGCRLLTQRQVGKIIPAVTNDISDWSETTRVKCSQLLYQLILNSEDKITMHSQPVIACILKSIGDSNSIVASFVQRSAKLLGYFVPFHINWALLSPRLESPNENALSVTACVLKGLPPSVFEEDGNILKILSLVASPSVCHTHATKRHFFLLEIANSLIDGGGAVAVLKKPETENIFRILLSVLAMSKDWEVKVRAIASLNKLRIACGFEVPPTVDALFSVYAPGIFKEIESADVLWGPSTPEKLIFSALLTHAGESAISSNLDVILEILVLQLDPGKEPEVRLQLLSDFATNLSNFNFNSESISVQTFTRKFIEQILLKTLIWKAGKSASALRAAALSCLLEIFTRGLIPNSLLFQLSPQLLSLTKGLLEDGYELNRLQSVQIIGHIFANCDPSLEPQATNELYPELLKRLDDEKDDVRVSAGVALSKIFGAVSPNYDKESFDSHLDFAISALLVHLDDQDQNIQAAVAEALKALGKISPFLLISKCEGFKSKHRSPIHCEDLIQQFQTV